MEHRINLNKYSLCCINFKDLERKKILLRTTRLESFQIHVVNTSPKTGLTWKLGCHQIKLVNIRQRTKQQL